MVRPVAVTKRRMSAKEKRWQAEDDARTLAEASAIRKDKSRMGMASKAAKSMVKEKADELSGLRSVARKNKRSK